MGENSLAAMGRFRAFASSLGLNVAQAEAHILLRGAGWLARASAVSGLSQYSAPKEALLRGMAPALTFFATDCPQSGRLADLGCGNGAIGATIAFFAPNLDVDLVDRAKRAYTTSELLVGKLNLTNAHAIQAAIEDLADDYDVAVFRALAPAGVALPLAASVVRPGGNVCAYHRRGDTEFERPTGDLYVLGTRVTLMDELVLTCYRR